MDSFLSIDTETTGLSFVDDRVIQFGMTVFVKRKAVFRTSFYIANTSVPNNGFHINQITDEQISSGYDPEYAFTLISSVIHKRPRVILAFNAPFDLMMLANEFRRYGIVYDFRQLVIVDPLVIHRHFRPKWPSPHNKLEPLCHKFGIPYENAHDAGYDSEAAGHLFMAQRTQFGIRGNIRNLHYKQAGWHGEWADSFQEWARSREREVNIVPWPCESEMACFLEGEQSILFLSFGCS